MDKNKKSECCGGGECRPVRNSGLTRRDFLNTSAKVGLLASSYGMWARPIMAGPFDVSNPYHRLIPADKKLSPAWVKSLFERGEKEVYSSEAAMEHIGMPVGGLFAGTVYLSADGRLWFWDVFNKESNGIAPQPFVFEGKHMKDNWGAHFVFPLKPVSPFRQGFSIRANGKEVTLDRQGFKEVTFRGEYPRAIVSFEGSALPVSAKLEAFSPFIPLNADDSGLPGTVMEYTVKNEGGKALDIEVVGHLENAVCLNFRDYFAGTIRNRVVKEAGFVGVECSAQSIESAAPVRNAREDIVFENFGKDAASRWTGSGDAFADDPFGGKGLGEVNSYEVRSPSTGERLSNKERNRRRDQAIGKRGTLISQPFKIERQYISARVNGDYNPAVSGLSVFVDGKRVVTATGNYSKETSTVSMDVSAYEGKQAYFEIQDEVVIRHDHLRQIGGIGVDDIIFTDTRVGELSKLETLPDFGTMTLALLGDDNNNLASALRGKNLEDTDGELGSELDGEVGRSVRLKPGEEAVFTFVISWNFPNYSNIQVPREKAGRHYASRFKSSTEVTSYLAAHSERLFAQTRKWVKTWYESSLPYWFLDRTMATTSTLATTTCQRFENGQFWAWEGVSCCSGTCTHVWQYAQSIARLFPEIEREMRDKVDFGYGQFENGGIAHRINAVPHPIIADDGQLGRILSVYREHQMTTDDSFLRNIWPRVKKAMEFIIDKNDPELDGMLEGDQRNTLDGRWYGKISWFSSLYMAGLRAMEEMATELGDTATAERCRKIAESGAKRINELYDGEYFIQDKGTDENKVGAGEGCFIDQIFGQSWAHWVGLGNLFDREKILSALRSIYKYNFITDFGPFREYFSQGRLYALAGDAGLIMCSWPKKQVTEVDTHQKYFFEFMTGFEWQAASHMIIEGIDHPDLLEHGLAVSRAIHDRYSGELRNPYNEIECGDHYGRALASYGAYQSMCGYEYHGPKGELSFVPRLGAENFRAAFTTAEGWGSFAQKVEDGKQTEQIDLRYGKLALRKLAFGRVAGTQATSVSVKINGKAIDAEFSNEGGHYTVRSDATVNLKAGQRLEVRFA